MKCQPVRLKRGGRGSRLANLLRFPPSLFKAIVHQRRGIGLEGLLVEAVFSNEPPTYCTDCTLQRGRFLTFTALPLVFRRRPEGDASAQRSPRLSRIPPPPLMGAPYKESLEVSYRNLASQPAYLQPLCFIAFFEFRIKHSGEFSPSSFELISSPELPFPVHHRMQ